ncbi:TetR/AcrR family transcriptional regulator [Georgenia sp. MJ173]|uniref:TetR/AcrR family transcriptional regulator n=1 Tax=Georgenia sunbinii TaxID=3117728 RepID=UPI002F265D91
MTVRSMARDPRTRRTLAQLTDAMDELLRTQSLADINVSELCRLAGVHRTTFYKHFSSVTVFTADFYSSLLDDIAVVSEEQLPEGRVAMATAYRDALVALLDHIAENRLRYRRMFAADGDHFFQRVVIDALSARAEQAHRLLVDRGAVIDLDAPTAARMVGAACAAALGEWSAQEETDSATRADQVMAALPSWWPHA